MNLSIIIASRNDGHGGDINGRTNNLIRNLDYHNQRVPIDFELIMVEWNPPADQPTLKDVLDAPQSYPLRIITVPPEIHQRVRYHEQIHFYQMLAKNVGIRRSRGDVILCTNCDVLFSEPLWSRIDDEIDRLDGNTICRADRVDVRDTAEPLSIDELLRWCKYHWIVRYGRDGVTSNSGERIGPERANVNACGDFQMASRILWMRMMGYPEIALYSWHLDSFFQYGCVINGVTERSFNYNECLYHIMHGYGKENINIQKELDEKKHLRLSDAKLNELIGLMYREGRYCFENEPQWGYADDVMEEVTLRKEMP